MLLYLWLCEVSVYVCMIVSVHVCVCAYVRRLLARSIKVKILRAEVFYCNMQLAS